MCLEVKVAFDFQNAPLQEQQAMEALIASAVILAVVLATCAVVLVLDHRRNQSLAKARATSRVMNRNADRSPLFTATKRTKDNRLTIPPLSGEDINRFDDASHSIYHANEFGDDLGREEEGVTLRRGAGASSRRPSRSNYQSIDERRDSVRSRDSLLSERGGATEELGGGTGGPRPGEVPGVYEFPPTKESHPGGGADVSEERSGGATGGSHPGGAGVSDEPGSQLPGSREIDDDANELGNRPNNEEGSVILRRNSGVSERRRRKNYGSLNDRRNSSHQRNLNALADNDQRFLPEINIDEEKEKINKTLRESGVKTDNIGSLRLRSQLLARGETGGNANELGDRPDNEEGGATLRRNSGDYERPLRNYQSVGERGDSGAYEYVIPEVNIEPGKGVETEKDTESRNEALRGSESTVDGLESVPSELGIISEELKTMRDNNEKNIENEESDFLQRVTRTESQFKRLADYFNRISQGENSDSYKEIVRRTNEINQDLDAIKNRLKESNDFNDSREGLNDELDHIEASFSGLLDAITQQLQADRANELLEEYNSRLKLLSNRAIDLNDKIKNIDSALSKANFERENFDTAKQLLGRCEALMRTIQDLIEESEKSRDLRNADFDKDADNMRENLSRVNNGLNHLDDMANELANKLVVINQPEDKNLQQQQAEVSTEIRKMGHYLGEKDGALDQLDNLNNRIRELKINAPQMQELEDFLREISERTHRGKSQDVASEDPLRRIDNDTLMRETDALINKISNDLDRLEEQGNLKTRDETAPDRVANELLKNIQRMEADLLGRVNNALAGIDESIKDLVQKMGNVPLGADGDLNEDQKNTKEQIRSANEIAQNLNNIIDRINENIKKFEEHFAVAQIEDAANNTNHGQNRAIFDRNMADHKILSDIEKEIDRAQALELVSGRDSYPPKYSRSDPRQGPSKDDYADVGVLLNQQQHSPGVQDEEYSDVGDYADASSRAEGDYQDLLRESNQRQYNDTATDELLYANEEELSKQQSLLSQYRDDRSLLHGSGPIGKAVGQIDEHDRDLLNESRQRRHSYQGDSSNSDRNLVWDHTYDIESKKSGEDSVGYDDSNLEELLRQRPLFPDEDEKSDNKSLSSLLSAVDQGEGDSRDSESLSNQRRHSNAGTERLPEQQQYVLNAQNYGKEDGFESISLSDQRRYSDAGEGELSEQKRYLLSAQEEEQRMDEIIKETIRNLRHITESRAGDVPNFKLANLDVKLGDLKTVFDEEIKKIENISEEINALKEREDPASLKILNNMNRAIEFSIARIVNSSRDVTSAVENLSNSRGKNPKDSVMIGKMNEMIHGVEKVAAGVLQKIVDYKEERNVRGDLQNNGAVPLPRPSNRAKIASQRFSTVSRFGTMAGSVRGVAGKVKNRLLSFFNSSDETKDPVTKQANPAGGDVVYSAAKEQVNLKPHSSGQGEIEDSHEKRRKIVLKQSDRGPQTLRNIDKLEYLKQNLSVPEDKPEPVKLRDKRRKSPPTEFVKPDGSLRGGRRGSAMSSGDDDSAIGK